VSPPTDPLRSVREAPDAIVALDALVQLDRAAAVRAALAVTECALEVQAPRPRAFVTIEHTRAWTDPDIACVAEALALVEGLAAAIARGDAGAEAAGIAAGRELAARVEA
jgi:hypothetical protein